MSLLILALTLVAIGTADAARIRSVEPATAAAGQTVTITGRGLAKARLTVGDVEPVVIERGRRSLTFIVPSSVASGPTEITVGKQKRRRARALRSAANFCVVAGETCDGVDNDCDGTADDGIVDVPIGVKAGGSNTVVVLRCRNGRFVGDDEDVESPPPSEPPLVGECIPGALEPCWDGPPEARGVGACQDGMRECTNDAVFGPCMLQVLPGDEDPGNGIDENCDGRDGPGGGELCIPGAIQSCYSGPPATRGIGRCHAGTRQCDQSGRYGSCVDQVLPGAEIAGNGIDEDCDGLDEHATRTLELLVDPALSPTFQASSVVTGAVGFALQPTTGPATQALIASLAPAEGHQGETLDVTITGQDTGFLAGLSQAAFGSGVVVEEVTVTSPTTAIARIAIAARASVGPRIVAVSTGREEAIAANAFAVLSGLGSVSGRIVDAEGNAVAGAEVCTSDGSVCTTTGADGTFVLDGVPIDTSRIIVDANGFDPFSLPVKVDIAADAGIGDLALAPPDEPPPPPLPNSPPVAGAVASFLGRGATRIREGGNPAALQKLVRDTIVAVGGDQAGVIGPDGTQQNPLVDGDGIVTLRQHGVEDIADKLAAAEITTLGEVLRLFVLGFNYGGAEGPPRLVDVLAAIQARVNAAWANPEAPGAALVFALFNDGFVATENPPVVNADTPLNSLQAYLLTTSLFTWVQQLYNDAAAGAAPAPAPLPQPLSKTRVARALAAAAADTTAESGAYSTTWASVFEQAAPLMGNQVKNRVTQLCQGATTVTPPACGPNAHEAENCCGNRRLEPLVGETCDPPGDLCDGACRFKLAPRPPGCKEVVALASILVSDRSDARGAAGNRFADFFLSEGASRTNAERIRQTFQSQSFQDAWTEAKTEAERRGLNVANRALNVARGLSEEFLSNIQGQAVNLIFGLEVDLIIQTMRPSAPFIDRAEQVIDADAGEPSQIVRIDFTRSLSDRGPDETEGVHWYYQLFRQSGATTVLVDSGQVGTSGNGPRPTADDRKLVFYDYVDREGSYIYRILAKRLVGSTPFETPPDEIDGLLKFVGGFVPLNFSTPGGLSITSGATLKTLLDPAAAIMKGLKFQSSDLSDPEPIYVRFGPPEPQPPANLAADPHSPAVYLSIPVIGRIFRANDGVLSLFADAGFKEPFQSGLGIDAAGNLYSDNAASDALFGGRVFQFAAADGARSLTGTVNKYSFLLGFARPVSVLAMVAGPSPSGEALYIADSFNQQVKVLRTFVPYDRSLNVAQPLASFAFGPTASLAVRADGAVVVSRYGELHIIEPGTNFTQPMFEAGRAPSPFLDVSGLAFDRQQNLYVSDAQRGFVMVIPRSAQAPRRTLDGYDDVAKAKQRVVIGRPKPRDVQVASDQRSVVFFDAERVTTQGFGMSGRVTGPTGIPLANATVLVEERSKVATTDADGVFVLPGLTSADDSTVVDVTIRHDGKTQTERVVLATVGHSVRDFRFAPPGLPGGGGTAVVDRPAPRAPVTVDTPPGANTVIGNLQVDVPTVGPGDTPPADTPDFGIGVLSPVDGMRTPEGNTVVKGFVTDPAVTTAEIIVNGVRQEVAVSGGEFEVPVPLGDGENTIAVAAFDAGPGGQVGLAASDVSHHGGLFGSIADSVGTLLGPASAGGGGIGGLITNIAGRVVPPDMSGALSGLLSNAQGPLASLRLGTVPSAADIAGLESSRNALSAVTSNVSGLLGNTSGGIANLVNGALGKINALNATLSSEAASTALRAFEVGAAHDVIQALPPGSLPPEFLAKATAVVGEIDGFVGDLQAKQVSNLDTTATSICNVKSEMETLVEGMTAIEQQRADAMMDAVRNIGSGGGGAGGGGGGGSGCSGLIGTVTKVVGQHTTVFAGIANLAGETLTQAFENPPSGVAIPALVKQTIGGLDSLLGPLTTDVLGGKVPAESQGAAIQAAAADVQTAVTTSGGGFLSGIVSHVSGIVGTVVPGIGGANGVLNQAVSQLSGPLSNLTDKIPDLLALPAEDKPPSAESILTPLAGMTARLLGNLDDRQLPSEADLADLQATMAQTQQVFETLSDQVRVMHDTALTAIEHIDGATGEVADVAISGRAVDIDSGQPVAGLELSVPGTGVKARSDRFGVFHALIGTGELGALVQGVAPILSQLNGNIGGLLATISSGDRATARKGLSDLLISVGGLLGKTPEGLPQQSAIEAALNEINVQAAFSISTIDAGNDLPPADVTELNEQYQELVEKLQDMVDTTSALLKSQHDSSLQVIANIK